MSALDEIQKKIDAPYKDMTLEQAEAELSKAVYQATAILEGLERVGHLTGNGHHARQKLAQAAVEELRARWKGPGSPS